MGDQSSMDNFETVKNALEKIESEMQGLRQKLAQAKKEEDGDKDNNMASKKRSEKYKDFLSLKTYRGDVRDVVPGVGPKLADQLKAPKCTQAIHLIEKFVLLNGDKEKFIEWLDANRGDVPVNADQKNEIYDAIEERITMCISK